MGNFTLERRRQVAGNRNQFGPGCEVLKIEVDLVERASHADDEPAPVRREAYTWPVLLFRGLEDQRIGCRVGAEPMEVESTVVVLLSLGHFPRRGIAGVVEAGTVRKPGDGGGPRVWDSVGQVPSDVDLEHVENALLAPVFR